MRSRVINLSALREGLNCAHMAEAMKTAFSMVYKLPAAPLELQDNVQSIIQEEAAHLASWDWLYGKPLPFSMECQEKFSWGYIQMQLHVEGGIIRQAKVYSDAMDWTLPQTLETVLRGACLSHETLRNILSATPLQKEICADLQVLFQKHIL